MKDQSPPMTLPEGSIGYVIARPDRPERLALYRPDGTLSNTFSRDEHLGDIARAAGLLVTRIDRVTGQEVGMWATVPAVCFAIAKMEG